MILCLGTTPAIARTMRFSSIDQGGVNRAADVYPYVGGKATNVARAVSNLGGDALCLGVQGGVLGAYLLSLLQRDRIAHRFLAVASPTRICTTVVDDARALATELIENAAELSAAEGDDLLQLFLGTLSECAGGANVVVLSGSLAPGLRSDYYARCIRIARDAGARVVLDASGDPLRDAIAAKPDVVKINAAELAGLPGAAPDDREESLIKTMRELARTIEGGVIVTRGSDSTLAIAADGRLSRVQPPGVDRVVSPIGCGDSFAGGVAVALSRGGSFQDALRLGTACAVANVQTPHAAHFDAGAVDRTLARVQLAALVDR